MKAFASCVTGLYILLLGASIGAILACGALSAPVIFNASQYLVEAEVAGMTRYASGILMTQIFLRLNYALNVVAVVILIYEALALNISSNKSKFLFGIGLFSAGLIFLFTLYYTPAIIGMQGDGAAATATEEFESIHTQSEMVMRILLFSLSVSLFWRVYLICFGAVNAATKSVGASVASKSSRAKKK